MRPARHHARSCLAWQAGRPPEAGGVTGCELVLRVAFKNKFKRPMVVSHTGVHGACRSKRNLSDEQMQRIAAKGGLVCIGYWKGAVCDISPERIVKALRYAIALVGEDHVALGSDFDGSTTTAFDTSELVVLTQEMMNYGFSDSQITKVMGGNSVKFLSTYLPK